MHDRGSFFYLLSLTGRSHIFCDTGSCISLVSDRVLEDFRLSSEVLPTNVCIRDVTSSQLGVTGTMYVTMRFGNIIFPHEFVVVKGCHSFPGHWFLGHDILFRSGVFMRPPGNPFHLSMFDSTRNTNINTSRGLYHPSNTTTRTDTSVSFPPPSPPPLPPFPPPSPPPLPPLSLLRNYLLPRLSSTTSHVSLTFRDFIDLF